VDAIAARDGAACFEVVQRVVSSGHAPRRCVEGDGLIFYPE